jgi:outer membrane protein assembly factor BamB
MYGRDPQGTRRSPVDTSCTRGVLGWSYSFGLPVSSPVIGEDGTVYVISGHPDGTVYVGSADSKLYAISPPASGTAGTLRWSYRTDSGPLYSPPAIGADGTIYVGSHDGNLYAIH